MNEQLTEQPLTDQQLTPQTQEQAEELSPALSVSSAQSAQSAFESPLDDLRSENERLRSEIRLMHARDEIVSSLTSEKARSPQLLFEACRDRLEFDDDGNLKSSGEIIAELKQRFPEQFVTEEPKTAPLLPAAEPTDWWPAKRDGVVGIPSINSGAGRSGHRMPLTKEQLARMKPREITRLDWNDVKQVLAA
jgi:hypothetical protein